MKGIKKIIAVLLVIALFCFNFHIISFAETSDTVKFNVSGRLYYDYAYEVLDILNELRTEKGLEALVMDEKLLESAMFRASETSILFSHTRPNGKPCYTAFADEETYGAGENIAIGYTSPKSVMSGWELSQGHYQNMVSIGYSSVGIGCYSSADGVLCWVQLFAGKKSTHSIKTGTKSTTYTIEAKRENLSLAFDYNKDIHSLKKGETFQINLINTNKEFYYAAEKLDNSYLSFSSSDNSVISFSQSGVGTITGEGKTTITVTSKIDNSLLLSVEYEGGHIYADSCASSCDLCGKTRGTYHSFADATCTKPKTCELCGVTQGEPLDHKFVGAGDAVCDICGFERELIYVLGDADGDQKVTTGDLAALKLYLAGSRELEEVSKTLCDLNGDGAVDTTDLAALKLKLAGV